MKLKLSSAPLSSDPFFEMNCLHILLNFMNVFIQSKEIPQNIVTWG